MREVTQTAYEWDIESTDAYGDIIDHDWSDKFPGLPIEPDLSLVLIKDVARGLHRLPDTFYLYHRAWAYVVDGKLPEEFDDGSKVPERFHKEINKATAND